MQRYQGDIKPRLLYNSIALDQKGVAISVLFWIRDIWGEKGSPPSINHMHFYKKISVRRLFLLRFFKVSFMLRVQTKEIGNRGMISISCVIRDIFPVEDEILTVDNPLWPHVVFMDWLRKYFFLNHYYAINDTDFLSLISSFIYPLLSLTEENVNSFNDGIGDNWSMNHIN